MPKTKRSSLVGVIHLPALPGAPRARESLRQIARRAESEARALEAAGFDAVVIENFGDVPFYKDNVPAITVSAMSVIAATVRDAVRLPIGINVLRNDGHSALAIAAVTGCQFIRVNVLSGAAATDQGIIEGRAAELMRERAKLEAAGTRIDVWGDVLVKHARTLSVIELEPAIEEVALRAMADAVILTGPTTGRAADLEMLRAAAELGLPTPLVLGSGATPENIARFSPFIDSVIVGSALRAGGKAGAPLESRRLKAFAKAWREAP